MVGHSQRLADITNRVIGSGGFDGLSIKESTLGTEGVRDEAWHDDLYRRYQPQMRRVARSLLGYQYGHEAEEVVQDTFMTAWEKRETLGEDPLPWLYLTTRNHVRNRQRTHGRLLGALARLGEPGLPHDGGLHAWERRHDFIPAWRAVSAGDRELLLMRYLHEMSDEQIAAVLGILPATARKRIQRARGRIRKVIEEMDNDLPAGAALPAGRAGSLAPAGARKGK